MPTPTSDAHLFEVMYTCRAMRRLRPDPVPEETLLALVDAALQAPSGSNAQNWRFIIVRDRAQKEKMRVLWEKTWGFYLDTVAVGAARPGEDLAARKRMLAAGTWQLTIFSRPHCTARAIAARAAQTLAALAPPSLAVAVVEERVFAGAVRAR